MIAPKDWTAFSSFDEKIDFLKTNGLTPPTLNYVKRFHYSGSYTEKPVLCSIEGYASKSSLVVRLGDGLHCINADYLMDMQAGFYRLPEEYIVIDVETTGLNPRQDRIIEFAGVKYCMGLEASSFVTLINPGCDIPYQVQKINNISNDMVSGAPCIREVLPSIRDFLGCTPIIAHNAPFDISFLKSHYSELSLTLPNTVLDTLALCRKAFPDLKSHSLSAMKRHLNIITDTEHRALPDVYATAQVLEECAKALSSH